MGPQDTRKAVMRSNRYIAGDELVEKAELMSAEDNALMQIKYLLNQLTNNETGQLLKRIATGGATAEELQAFASEHGEDTLKTLRRNWPLMELEGALGDIADTIRFMKRHNDPELAKMAGAKIARDLRKLADAFEKQGTR